MLVISASLFSLQCFASTKAFDVKAEVSLDGKLISRPHIVTKPNELASINQKLQDNRNILIEMTANDYHSKNPKNGIMMKFTVSRLDAGKRTVLATPQIVALPGEEAMMEIGKANAETVKVTVIATRVE
jgi:hypothetical protein